METSSKIIGEGLRRLFATFVRRPLGWNLIDAFARLEEREEQLGRDVETNESGTDPLQPLPEPGLGRFAACS